MAYARVQYEDNKTPLNADILNRNEVATQQLSQDVTALSEAMVGFNAQLETVLNKTNRVLYVKDFKCVDGEYVKGDGIHDDTSGIQLAFDSLGDGDTLIFNKGTYKINRVASNTFGVSIRNKKNIALIGENSTLTSVEDLTVISYAMLKVVSCSNIKIEGFNFKTLFSSNANTRSNAYAVQFDSSFQVDSEVGCSNVMFIKNIISSRPVTDNYGELACYGVLFGSYPDRITGRVANGFTCENNTFIDCEGRGVQTWKAKNVKILNNSFLNCGYFRSLNVIRMIGGVEGLIVANNTITAAPNSLRVVGVTVGTGTGSSELYNAEDVNISNNVIKIDSGTSENKSIGINLIGCVNGVISSNTITTKNMLNGSVVGVAIDEDNFKTENMLIINNNINGCSISQISINTTNISNITIAGNYLGINNYSPTSSSTVKGVGASLCRVVNNYSQLHNNIVNSVKNQVVGYVASALELPNPAVFPSKVGDIYYNTSPLKDDCVGWVIVLDSNGYKKFAKFGMITTII